jgi:hypothetical protein
MGIRPGRRYRLVVVVLHTVSQIPRIATGGTSLAPAIRTIVPAVVTDTNTVTGRSPVPHVVPIGIQAPARRTAINTAVGTPFLVRVLRRTPVGL